VSRKSNVLIVTGEESQKKELEAILYDKYVTEVCSNGKEAFDYLNNHFPDVDLVITAIPLESIDGFELLRLMKISKVLNVVPVLVLIENEDTEDIRKAMGFGAEDIIELPEVSEVIRNRVDTIIRLTRKPDYKNVMEELVIEQIDKYIDKLGICKCPTCRCDLAALALNHLKPKYVNTEKGRLISVTDKMSYDNILEIVGVIAECAESVKMNPRHTLTRNNEE